MSSTTVNHGMNFMPTFDLLGHLTFNLPITNVGDKASVEIILALFMKI